MAKDRYALIVDDEVEIGLILTKILGKAGLKADAVTSISDALGISDLDRYSYFFIDLNLPDGVGFELISELKRISPHAKLFVVSAYDGASEMAKANELGVNGFISKPFTKQTILNMISLH